MADAPEGTDLLAFQAPDAVRAVGGLINADADRAFPLAFAAERAGLLVHGHPEQADLVEEPEDGPERAGRPAEGPHDEDHPDEESREDRRLPGEQKAELAADRGIQEGQGDPRLERSGRADPLAEPGLSPAERVEDEEGQEDGQDDEEDVLEIPQEPGDAELGRRDLVDELLEEPEGAYPAARQAADGTADGPEEADDIEAELAPGEREVEPERAQGILERPDRAGAEGRRARIAVEHGNAEALGRALIDAAFEERGRCALNTAAATAWNQRLFFCVSIALPYPQPMPTHSRQTVIAFSSTARNSPETSPSTMNRRETARRTNGNRRFMSSAVPT